MARKTMKKNRRTRKPKLNLVNVGQTVVVANEITSTMFNTNIVQFLTGNTTGSSANGLAYGSDGSALMSLPELLGIGPSVKFGGNYGTGRSFSTQWRANLAANGGAGMLAAKVILIPVAFKIGKAVTSPLRREVGKGLKFIGIKGVTV